MAICLTLGIVTSRLITQYSFVLLGCAALLLISAAGLYLHCNRPGPSLALGLLAIGLCGLLHALALRDGFPESDVRSFLSHNSFPLEESLGFDGCVVEESQRRGDETTSTVELRAVKKDELWLPCQGKGLLRLAGSQEDGPGSPGWLRIGDRVRGWATWRVPRNYQNPGSTDHSADLLRRGIVLIGRIKSPRLLEVVPQDCAPFWNRAVVAVRNGLRTSLQLLAQRGKQREAAILASVVIGDYSELDTQTREAFQNTGTYHVLVVSGLHVAWIAWVFLRFFELLRVPRGIGRALSAMGILFYACVIGFQASISRCLWMFMIYLAGESLFRRASPTNILFGSALILLVIRPDWLMDAGFQLSFLSVMAICQMAVPLCEGRLDPVLEPVIHAGDKDRISVRLDAPSRLGRRWRCRCELLVDSCEDRWGAKASKILSVIARNSARLVSLLAGTIIVSASVQVWLEMVLAYHFNRLSWISPLANIVAVPVSSLVLASGVALGLFANIPILGQSAQVVSGWLASFLLSSNLWMSRMPGAWQRCPTPSLVWVLTTLVVVAGWCLLGFKRLWIPSLLVAISLAILSVGRNLGLAFPERGWRKDSTCLRLTFLDVGEGDSIILRIPDGRVWLVDAGGVRQSPSQEDNAGAFDVGEAVVSKYLWHQWLTRLDRLVISHPDVDHAGGARSVLKNFDTHELDFGDMAGDLMLDRILSVARAKHITTRIVKAGEMEVEGGVAVHILNPPRGSVGRTTNENSVVLRVVFGDFSALLTGDLEKSGEAELAAGPENLRSVLLKVAHHGSRSATLDPLISRVLPLWAIVSVGRNNPFGHPSREVLLRLLRHGVRPFLTQDQGAVTVTTDGRHYLIEGHVSGILQEGTLPKSAQSD